MTSFDFLSEDNKKLIERYELHQHCSLLVRTSEELFEKYDKPKSKKGVSNWLCADISKLSSIDQLTLIRGLCDRIESKITEVKS